MDNLTQFPEANSEISVEALVKANEILRKSQTAGYQTAASGGFPLAPQSLQTLWETEDYADDEIALWPMIKKTPVQNTLHEANVITSYGNFLDPFIAEGGGGTESAATVEKRTVRVKYLAEKISVTDPLAMLGLSDGSQGLQFATEQAMKSLTRKIEASLLHADSDANPLAYDGIIKQIATNGNTKDMLGASLDPKDLLRAAWTLKDRDHSNVSHVLCSLRTEAYLKEYAEQFKRGKFEGSGDIRIGDTGLEIVGPGRSAKVVGVPFLNSRNYAPLNTGNVGNAPVPGAAAAPFMAAAATSRFGASDAGEYVYRFVGVRAGDGGGIAAPVAFAAATVAAGESVRLDIGNGTGVTYWRIYRTTKNGDIGTSSLIAQIPINALGGAGTTRFTDLNLTRPEGEIVIMANMPSIEFVQYLDLIRRPLSDNQTTTKNALLMLFGAPFVKKPRQSLIIKNIASPDIGF